MAITADVPGDVKLSLKGPAGPSNFIPTGMELFEIIFESN